MRYLAFIVGLSAPAVAANDKPYVLNAIGYASAAEALAKQKVEFEAGLAKVPKLDYAGGSILVHCPNDSALAALSGSQTESVRQYSVESYRNAFVALAEALRRSRVFDSVSFAQADAYLEYAKKMGYRYVLTTPSHGQHVLYDLVSGEKDNISGPRGFANTASLVSDSVQRFSRHQAAPTSKAVSQADAKKATLKFDGESNKGHLTLAGNGLQTRAVALAAIGRFCSSKNVGVKAGQEDFTGGVYTTSNESIDNGTFAIDFECLY